MIKEKEVDDAYQSFKMEEKAIFIDLGGESGDKIFRAFCSDHVEHFWHDLYAPKRVDFWCEDEEGLPTRKKQSPDGKDNLIGGQVYLNGSTGCSFGPFCPPKTASLKPLNLTSHEGFQLSFTFISDKYLRLTIPYEMALDPSVSKSSAPPPSTGLKVLELVGIWHTKEEQDARLRELRSRRAPSPGDSYFEMSHPMGAWNQGY